MPIFFWSYSSMVGVVVFSWIEKTYTMLAPIRRSISIRFTDLSNTHSDSRIHIECFPDLCYHGYVVLRFPLCFHSSLAYIIYEYNRCQCIKKMKNVHTIKLYELIIPFYVLACSTHSILYNKKNSFISVEERCWKVPPEKFFFLVNAHHICTHNKSCSLHWMLLAVLHQPILKGFRNNFWNGDKSIVASNGSRKKNNTTAKSWNLWFR